MEDRQMKYDEFEAIVDLLDVPQSIIRGVKDYKGVTVIMPYHRALSDSEIIERLKNFSPNTKVNISIVSINEEDFKKETLLQTYKNKDSEGKKLDNEELPIWQQGSLETLVWKFQEGKAELEEYTYSMSIVRLFPRQSKIEIHYVANMPTYLDTLLKTASNMEIDVTVRGNPGPSQ